MNIDEPLATIKDRLEALIARNEARTLPRRRPAITHTQLYVAIGLPTIAVITSLVISLVQISGIREDIRELARIAESHDRRLGNLEKDPRQ